MSDKTPEDAERLEKALHFSNTMRTFNLSKQNLQVKAQNQLSFSTQGGTFNITQELIGFVGTLKSMGITTAVVLDKNDLPIHIADLDTFLTEITELYLSVTNEYYIEYQNLKSSRNIGKVLGIA